MTAGDLAAIAARLAGSTALRAKRDIARVASCIDAAPAAVHRWREQTGRILLGDDTAAIPDGAGYLLLAAEGILPSFVERDPYFAGWCSVMVNVNDIAAMGGFPLALVDVFFHGPSSPVERVLSGMIDACRSYGVPLVGGHTTRQESEAISLSVAILGRADCLLTSFGAALGDVILFAVDLRGHYRSDFAFWNATRGRSAASLRGDLAALETLALGGVVNACKDVSNAGVVGTLLMMLEASGRGGVIDLDRIPRPDGVELERWLLTFPSYGFVFATNPDCAPTVRRVLGERGLACEAVGRVDDSSRLRLARHGDEALLWDLAKHPLTGFKSARSSEARERTTNLDKSARSSEAEPT
jgi:AIR synthase-related protein